MARILVFQHDAAKTSGRLGMTLRDHGFKLDTRRVDLASEEGGDPFPADLDGVHGVLALGGPQNVDQNHAWMKREREILAEAHARGLPVVGICLGAQLLAEALGGKVEKLAAPEVGFTRVRILPPGQTETILAGVPWESQRFEAHAYGVTELPAGAQLLASSDACKVQCYKVGMRSFGFQFHFELDRPGIEGLLSDESHLLKAAGVSRDQIEEQLNEHYGRFVDVADRLCVNLASYAFPFSELLAV